MATAAATFDNSLAQWTKEQSLPWGRLKYRLVQANLAKHIEQGPLHILDAGGGNGFDSIPLAEQGHSVHIVDYSTGMLAEASHHAAMLKAQERVSLRCADVRNIPDLFPDQQFDLVLCHNVLQYVDDVAALLKSLIVLLKTGGLISVVSINRYSIPYHTAFLHGNLTDALAQLDARSMKGSIFDTTLINYCADEVSDMLKSIGCVVEQDYGIRCICDYWGDNERKSDPTVFEQIERLELALTDKHPYKLLARYFQVIASKT
jgi:S-adenosylmethionine-dependent methyltransferase